MIFMPKNKAIRLGPIFSWFALSMWIYTTLAVTQHLPNKTQPLNYNTGANQVGEMFANYNLIAALAAFLLPLLAKYTSRKFTHFVALVCGGLTYLYLLYPRTNNFMEWLQ
jgi:maltose/moltooligosaccharide transporter